MTSPEPEGDRYGDWDAAYVLGALSPAERSEFEAHLAACPRCQAAVSEIAGLPGLLSQVGPEDAARLTDPRAAQEPSPESLLPTVLATARRQHTRARTQLLAVAACLALVLGGLLLGQVLDRLGPAQQQRIAFEPVGSSEITAVVDLVPIATGTRVAVECQDADGYSVGSSLSVVVADRSGHRQAVKEWVVKPDKVNRPSGETPLRVSQIAAVEIRETATDALVLRAPVR
ncbi:Putative zinc-finger [Friedmanniella luteola]|uniref:Putative zinc-finger n=1 Tax=Friedmanniella luteola TaxID=546871 RepID=A0A1H1ZZ80_9ACTN|nr:zf-HC2 domain-containing protein [Friedmanniella luteola]SDT39111.1 Putative zinc-finger [Friedmanniella luteola]